MGLIISVFFVATSPTSFLCHRGEHTSSGEGIMSPQAIDLVQGALEVLVILCNALPQTGRAESKGPYC